MTTLVSLSRSLPLGAGLVLVSVFPAMADPLTFTNDSGGTVKLYGQVSPSYLHFDDGHKSYDNVLDNSHSNTRVGLLFDQDFDNGQHLQFKFETGLGIPTSADYSQRDKNPDWVWEKTDLRYIDLAWSGGFGKITVGQGSMATDDVTGHDFSETTLISSVTTADTAGAYFFREKHSKELSGYNVSSVYRNLDGDRKGRIRYDTPSWNGFSVAVAYGTDVLSNYFNDKYYDVAASYNTEFSGIKLGAGIGYAWVKYDYTNHLGESWSGSVSALHEATGLNGTMTFGAERDNGHYIYTKLGWIANFWDVGHTAFSADYYYGKDFVHDGTKSQQWGLQAQQKFDDLHLEAFLGYGAYDFDGKSADPSYHSAKSFMTGVRWTF